MNASDYAVVVGISRYGSITPELEGPEKDARAFYDWVIAASGGDVPKENVALVLSSQYRKNNAELNGDLYGYEPTLIQQLDDMIARVVTADADVLGNLLTTRLHYLAAPMEYAQIPGHVYNVSQDILNEDDYAPDRD